MGNNDPEEGDLRKEVHMMTSSHSSLKECCLLDRKTVWTPPNFWCVGRSGTYRNEHFGSGKGYAFFAASLAWVVLPNSFEATMLL